MELPPSCTCLSATSSGIAAFKVNQVTVMDFHVVMIFFLSSILHSCILHSEQSPPHLSHPPKPCPIPCWEAPWDMEREGSLAWLCPQPHFSTIRSFCCLHLL